MKCPNKICIVKKNLIESKASIRIFLVVNTSGTTEVEVIPSDLDVGVDDDAPRRLTPFNTLPPRTRSPVDAAAAADDDGITFIVVIALPVVVV
jgi:hypothetical protein